MLSVSARSLGRRKPLFSDWSISLPPEFVDESQNSLRDLIAAIVRIEVDEYHNRRQQRRLSRALTATEIEEAVEKGKVDMGGREEDPKTVDVAEAVETALTAFEDGIFLVAVDDRQYRTLDEPVVVGPDSRITFIRLTLLAGG